MENCPQWKIARDGKLPAMENREPPRMCAMFQDGTTYQRDDTLSIDVHHERTGQSFDYMECGK